MYLIKLWIQCINLLQWVFIRLHEWILSWILNCLANLNFKNKIWHWWKNLICINEELNRLIDIKLRIDLINRFNYDCSNVNHNSDHIEQLYKIQLTWQFFLRQFHLLPKWNNDIPSEEKFLLRRSHHADHVWWWSIENMLCRTKCEHNSLMLVIWRELNQIANRFCN